MPSAMRGRVSRVASGKLFVLIITNFVDMVGLLMIIPLLPFYAREMGGGSLQGEVFLKAPSSILGPGGVVRLPNVPGRKIEHGVRRARVGVSWLTDAARIEEGARRERIRLPRADPSVPPPRIGTLILVGSST